MSSVVPLVNVGRRPLPSERKKGNILLAPPDQGAMTPIDMLCLKIQRRIYEGDKISLVENLCYRRDIIWHLMHMAVDDHLHYTLMRILDKTFLINCIGWTKVVRKQYDQYPLFIRTMLDLRIVELEQNQ